MREPLIVGVRHALEPHVLLDQHCQQQFQKKILPLITDDTLLLLEGSYRAAFYKKEDWLYSWRKRDAERFIGAPIGADPTIGWRDGRFLKYSDINRTSALLEYAGKHIGPHVILSDSTPRTYNELCEFILSGQLAYRMSEELDTESHLTYCSEILKRLGQFEWPTMASAHAWQASERQVIILCGALHALTMHRNIGWPVVFLLDDDEAGIRDLMMSIIMLVLYPEAALRKMLRVSP